MTQQEKQEIDKKCDEFCEYRRTHSNGYPPREWFMAGVKALDELRKPSERPNIKDYFAATETLGAIHGEIVGAPRLYAYMQALDAYIDSLEAKPSEPEANAGEAGEELVHEIKAELMQPDKELLGALKDLVFTAEKLWNDAKPIKDTEVLTVAHPIIEQAKKAISKYEKQSK